MISGDLCYLGFFPSVQSHLLPSWSSSPSYTLVTMTKTVTTIWLALVIIKDVVSQPNEASKGFCLNPVQLFLFPCFLVHSFKSSVYFEINIVD